MIELMQIILKIYHAMFNYFIIIFNLINSINLVKEKNLQAKNNIQIEQQNLNGHF